MGLDIFSTAIIGLRVEASELRETQKRRVCEHPLPADTDAEYCAQCGIDLWEDDEFWKPFISEDYDKDWYLWIGDIPVFAEEDGEGFAYIIGAGVRTDSHRRNADGDAFMQLEESLEQIRERLRGALEPLGLWNEAGFGLYAITEASW